MSLVLFMISENYEATLIDAQIAVDLQPTYTKAMERGRSSFPSLRWLPFLRGETIGGRSAEIAYWSQVTTQNWAVLLISWRKFPLRNDKSEVRSQIFICVWNSAHAFIPRTSFRRWNCKACVGIKRDGFWFQLTGLLKKKGIEKAGTNYIAKQKW